MNCEVCGLPHSEKSALCKSCTKEESEGKWREAKRRSVPKFFCAFLWLLGFFFVLSRLGHPLTFLPIIWEGKITTGYYFETYEEEVEDDHGNTGVVDNHIYKFRIGDNLFEASSESDEFGESARIKYLPRDPSIAFLDGKGWHSATSQAIRYSLLSAGVLSGILFAIYIFARDGFRCFR